ncbi:hypothetical protein F5B22DRAFT_228656 [Xylaria bambusicola]|uniref:uncharacterized protein n=1 Tax=Xylaria bambusicola TaxID=326684 RepID=UPI0020080FEC|nr:uncharacterized protein F5B22DRAFT_228656 [Xylaria bambusicola]KAI0514740.1 hypothetical protein F5B22DRAFT_228656 [Xylaria bambusicola]
MSDVKSPYLTFHLPACATAFQHTIHLDGTWANHQKCIEMKGTQIFNPQSAESIYVKFAEGGEGIVSVVMFDLRDEHLGGVRRHGHNEKEVICSPENVQHGLCDKSELGQFLISQRAHRRALRPMITRAVNLSKPISIQYPVEGPGYYCTALFGYSAREFMAEMTAVAPGYNLPTFRSDTRRIYGSLAPIWLVIYFVLAGFFVESTVLRENPSLTWIGTSSLIQVLIRWAALEIGGTASQHPIIYIAWYTFSGCQDALVLHHMLSYAQRRSDSQPTALSKWVSRFMVIVFVILFAGASLADFQATSSSKTPAYVNVFLGGYLALCFSVSLFRMLRLRSSAAESLSQRHEAVCRSLVGFTVISIVVTAGLGTLNLWALIRSRAGDEALFASMFWPSRFWLIDMPFEPLFLVLVLALTLTDYSKAKSTSATVYTKREIAGPEWGSIHESIDEDRLSDEQTAGSSGEGEKSSHTKA